MRSLLATLIFACSLICQPALAIEYDLVIANGTVIDPETKLDAVRHVDIAGRLLVKDSVRIEGRYPGVKILGGK